MVHHLGGQADREEAALPDTRALRLHVAAVQSDETLHQREADPEAAFRAIDRQVHLREHLEHLRDAGGAEAYAVVLHGDGQVLRCRAPR
jgi:hypothetical protein